MALKMTLFTTIGMAIAAQASATNLATAHVQGAPPASENAQYCLRAEAVVGTRIETVVCRTRAEWAEWDVDVDQEWAKEGVRVINA